MISCRIHSPAQSNLRQIKIICRQFNSGDHQSSCLTPTPHWMACLYPPSVGEIYSLFFAAVKEQSETSTGEWSNYAASEGAV
jgi:hypothetical protein